MLTSTSITVFLVCFMFCAASTCTVLTTTSRSGSLDLLLREADVSTVQGNDANPKSLKPLGCPLQVNVTDYKGKLCLAVAKRHFNGVAIAIIVVGSLLGVFLLALLVWCCCRCCRW